MLAIMNGDGARTVGHHEMLQAGTAEMLCFAPERIVIQLRKIAFEPIMISAGRGTEVSDKETETPPNLLNRAL
ncbi:hypothetical protein DEA98_18925 [Brucella pseudogrignonensis]|nr:hypothetical protein [Brucella pseudogrignonensis]